MQDLTGQAVSDGTKDIFNGIFDIPGESPTHSGGSAQDAIKNLLVIKPEFKSLPPQEGLARSIQSEFDKITNTAQTYAQKNEELLAQARFLSDLESDPQLRRAWIAKVDPELVPTDVTELVKKQVQKEFGKDFQPKEEERSDPFSKTSQYYARVSKLINDYNDSKPVKTVEEIMNLRKAETDGKKKQFENTLKKIVEEEKWDEDTTKRYVDFYRTMVQDLYAVKKVFKFTEVKAGRMTSKMGAKASTGLPVTLDGMSQTLDSWMGKPKSGIKKST